MRRNQQGLPWIAAALLFGACTPDRPPTQDESIDAALAVANGGDIAAAHCASCHALGASSHSPRSDAPPLRTILSDYDPEMLAIDFMERVHVGAEDMPNFDLGPKGIDALVAYLVSIQQDSDDP